MVQCNFLGISLGICFVKCPEICINKKILLFSIILEKTAKWCLFCVMKHHYLSSYVCFVFPEQTNTGKLFCTLGVNVCNASCCVLNMFTFYFYKQFVLWWVEELVVFIHLHIQNYTGLQWLCSQVVGGHSEHQLTEG